MGGKLPDILLVVCDSLGARHLPMYGYSRNTSPFLEKAVDKGRWAIYKNFFSTSHWTLPSHASMFTGLYPSQHDINSGQTKLNLFTIVEALREMGYVTVGISGNNLIHRTFIDGWSEFYEVVNLFPSNLILAQMEKSFVKNLYVKGKLRSFLEEVANNALKHPGETVKFVINKVSRRWANPLRKSFPFTRRIVDIVRKIKGRENRGPLFVFINIMETHHDYNPPAKFLRFFTTKRERIQTSEAHNFYNGSWTGETLKHIVDLYDSEILCLDWKLKELVEIWDKGIIFITSDHGDLHGEHGAYSHTFTTYNGLVHVPLLVRWPGEWGIKGEISDLCQITDLYATIMDIVDAPFPSPPSSVSLLSSSPREWAVMQSIDVNFQIYQIKSRVPHLEPDPNMQPMMSLITRDLWKITERMDGSMEIHNLNRDFYESGEGEDLSSPKGRELARLLQEKKRELGYEPIPVTT